MIRGRARAWCRDVVEHVAVTISRTPGRALGFGAAACAASALLTVGVTDAAGRQAEVHGAFDALAARVVQVTTPVRASPYEALGPAQLEAIRSIEGVTGLAWAERHDVAVASPGATAVPSRLWTIRGDLEVLGLEIADGSAAGPTYGLLVGGGGPLADVGGRRFDHALVGGRRIVVDGTVTRSPVIPDLLDTAALVGPDTPLSLRSEGELAVAVRPGWAPVVAPRLATLLAPGRESSVLVRHPPEAGGLRADVLGSVGSLVYVTSAAILALGSAAVMVGTLFRVLAERRLLGLYRAIGGSSAFVVGTLVLEAGVVGASGSAVGTVLGLGVASARALVSGSALSVPWWWVGAGALVGLVTNSLGALVPALLTVREPPLAALRAR